jgi:hypothetical protein
MRLRYLLFAGVLLDLTVAAMAAVAGTVVVGPDACPVPAEAPAFIPESEIAAPDLETRLRVIESVVILYDTPLGGAEGDGLFGRLTLDLKTGLPFGAQTDAGCAPRPAAPQ